MTDFKNRVKEIQEKVKTQGIIMNRVPDSTRQEFIKFSKDEFCDDRGLCFKYVWDQFKIWKLFFENIDMKLDKIIDNTQPSSIKVEENSENSIRLLSGRELKGGNKDEETK